MRSHLFLLTLVLGNLALSACGISDVFREDEKPPLEGERISILELQKALEPDDTALELQGLITPSAWRNAFWPQAGGYPNHAMQNLALSDGELQRFWSADIGQGSTDGLPLVAQPILVENTIFTLDSDAQLSAFNTQNGRKIWDLDIAREDEDDVVIGGGIAFSSGVLYVTNGFDELLAVNPKDGEVFWRKSLPAPARAAPTVLDGRVFVTTLDNKLIALRATDGQALWEYLGLAETAGLIGAASPAASRDVVIPVFSSGEISALRVTNGSLAWSDNLSNLRSAGGLSTISDIKALPVIDKDLIIAISFSGRLVAIDARTGTRIWQREISGSQTPWVAGNHIFVLSSDHKLIAVGRGSGTIRWITDLAAMVKEDRNTLSFVGPVFAGGRLIVAGSRGVVFEIDPQDGRVIRNWDAGDTVSIAPIVAGGVLYILSEDGRLSAYR